MSVQRQRVLSQNLLPHPKRLECVYDMQIVNVDAYARFNARFMQDVDRMMDEITAPQRRIQEVLYLYTRESSEHVGI